MDKIQEYVITGKRVNENLWTITITIKDRMVEIDSDLPGPEKHINGSWYCNNSHQAYIMVGSLIMQYGPVAEITARVY